MQIHSIHKGFGGWRGYPGEQEGGTGFCRMGVWTVEEEKERVFTESLAEEKGEKRTEQMGGADGSQLGSDLLCAAEMEGADGRGRHEERVAKFSSCCRRDRQKWAGAFCVASCTDYVGRGCGWAGEQQLCKGGRDNTGDKSWFLGLCYP